jgi:hypothetical protein
MSINNCEIRHGPRRAIELGLTPKERVVVLILASAYLILLALSMINLVITFKSKKKRYYDFMRVLHILFFLAVYFRLTWLIDPLPAFFDAPPFYSSNRGLHTFAGNLSFGFFLIIYSYSAIVWIAKVSRKLRDSESRKHYTRKTITLTAYLLITTGLLLTLTQATMDSTHLPIIYCSELGLSLSTLSIY